LRLDHHDQAVGCIKGADQSALDDFAACLRREAQKDPPSS
jgi:hypothetical protein